MGILGDSRFGKLFEDEDFLVDEKSREFQALNPSTKAGEARTANSANVDNGANESDSGDHDDDDDEVRSSKQAPIAKPDMRISSSSYKKSGHQRRDKPLGSRTKGRGRVSKNRGEVVGERQVTFAPSAGRVEKEKTRPQKRGRRDDGRRSASGNVFRNL
jgi:ribosome biogenesis protein ENP2